MNERADVFAPVDTMLSLALIRKGRREGYIKGATDQRNIDFENAWVAYCACCYCGCEINPDKCEKIKDFKKELKMLSNV